ncbi:MAG: FAD-dependent oxidoreductase [Candidatus Omnitrophica bacterium]|nr:FAD-dependent oxidoreductase [Candidatus Omnitrophota bacterium]
MKKIAIIGAGPTGLGAAFRLRELDHDNFKVFERNAYPGGLCASFRDAGGFTWDLGGHVIFSHYKYFDSFFDGVLKGGYFTHKRNAWIRSKGRWIPYPFQNHIKYLPKAIIDECVESLKEKRIKPRGRINFKEWLIYAFGKGFTRHFFSPYNLKVWGFPLEELSVDWVGERISRVQLKDVIRHLLSDTDLSDWGPNALFKYPAQGGVGEIFRKASVILDKKIRFNSEVVRIERKKKRIYFSDNSQETYEALINTGPLNKLLHFIDGCPKRLLSAANELRHNGVFVVGIGIQRPCPSDKCWMYFPDSNSPFFRVTYLSNYSPRNVPDSNKYYSLLCESAYSKYKKEKKSEILNNTIKGLINSGIIGKFEKKHIVSTFVFDIDYAYPIPTIKRDMALREIQPALEKMGIYSRGRFGSWRYEIGNTDHSFLQGKEVIDRLVNNTRERVWGNG